MIVWNSHVDTSPEFSGTQVKPVLHWNYDGNDIVLPGDKTRVIRVKENADLTGLKGTTIITTDGTTLLGGDDKAGVAVIMAAAEQLMSDRTIPHGPVKVLGLEAGVNITVGLPMVRTSVDHGTAFDIAGKGIADERSLIEGLRQAAELAPR